MYKVLTATAYFSYLILQALGVDELPAASVACNGKIYGFYKETRSHFMAHLLCQQWGLRYEANNASLASIINQETQDCLLKTIKILDENWEHIYSPYHRGYYVGGSDFTTEGLWKWQDGTTIPTKLGGQGYQNWAANEPNNHSGTEHCMLLLALPVPGNQDYSTGKWVDVRCDLNMGFICEAVPLDYIA